MTKKAPKSATDHGAIRKQPYHDADIRDYIDQYVTILFQGRKERKFNNRVFHLVKQLPPWVQILLLENDIDITIGHRSALGLSKRTAGAYVPESFGQGEILSRPYRGPRLEMVLAHEIGHALDNMLRLNPAGNASVDNYSDLPVWEKAATPDMERRHRPDLYTGYVPLHKRIASSRYVPEQYASEAFAKITEYYLTLKRYKKGDEDAADTLLEQQYPSLWPCYRDQFMPWAINLSSTFWEAKKEQRTLLGKKREAEFEQLLGETWERMTHLPHPPKEWVTMISERADYLNIIRLFMVGSKQLSFIDTEQQVDTVFGLDLIEPSVRTDIMLKKSELPSAMTKLITDAPNILKLEGFVGLFSHYDKIYQTIQKAQPSYEQSASIMR